MLVGQLVASGCARLYTVLNQISPTAHTSANTPMVMMPGHV